MDSSNAPAFTPAALALCGVAMAHAVALAQPADPMSRVGPAADNSAVVTTAQTVRPAGQVLELGGSRPVDLVLAPDATRLYVKDNHGLIAIDPATMAEAQRLNFPRGGGSMIGLAITRDERHLYATDSGNTLHEATRNSDGVLAWTRQIALPAPKVGGAAFGCGIALSPDERTAYVCCSRGNVLAVVNLSDASITASIDVGVAPYAVAVSPDGTRAYVTNWGGRRAREGDQTAPSAGTPTVVDDRGIAASGTLSVVDLTASRSIAEIHVGHSPAALALTPDGKTLYVASANDDTFSVLDTTLIRETRDDAHADDADRAVITLFSTRPDDHLPFGSMPSAMCLSPDATRLYVANAGNNAVAVVDVSDPASPRIEGFIPTGWFPGAVAVRRAGMDERAGAAGAAPTDTLFIANIRGTGSRQARGDGAFNSHRHTGSVQRVPMPDPSALAAMTRQCLDDARVPQILAALDRARPGVTPVPIPRRAGEPSPIRHVVYIIKENRTYDQVFGDLASDAEGNRGNGMPGLCIYGRNVTPNQHALAEQFVLLDNYYCNGVLSADGHSWATEGNVTPYLERSFGGFARSYTFGDDPLTYSASGFIWDHVLAAGGSFRNYGEFDETHERPDVTLPEVWADWQAARAGAERRIRFTHDIGVANVRRYSNPDSPGWNLDIPDQIRADVFIDELARFEAAGDLPNLVIIYLPNDHTSGTGAGKPTPRAQVADNDLALGRIVDAISHSRFWPSTAIFVNEDDPQDGWDHVDGHRSTCLVISPYARRGRVVSNFYNQAGVVHTIERILGVPGANQRYALAPVMFDCFTSTPDLAPFTHLPSNVDICEMNPAPDKLPEKMRRWADLSMTLDFARVDACPEDLLNRILWHDAKGPDVPFPTGWAGPHARGLPALGLRAFDDPSPLDDALEEAWEHAETDSDADTDEPD